MSWNIQNLGQSKFKNDSIMGTICITIAMQKPDVVAIQEVSTSKWGDSAIIKIAKRINYNYVISNKTTGEGSERYAFIYPKTTLLLKAELDTTLQDSIDREPYIGQFKVKKKLLIVRTIHTVPDSKNPQYEISKLYKYNEGIICGDFNLTDEHLIYIPLLKKYNSPLKSLQTSLHRDGSLNKSYDHFLIDKKYIVNTSYVYLYPYIGNRNKVSDHLPIILKLQ